MQKEVRAYIRARVVGYVEAARNMFEFRCLRINASVQPLYFHSHRHNKVLERKFRLPRFLKSSLLEIYFKRPSKYHDLEYMTYYETVRVYEKLPHSISKSEATIDG